MISGLLVCFFAGQEYWAVSPNQLNFLQHILLLINLSFWLTWFQDWLTLYFFGFSALFFLFLIFRSHFFLYFALDIFNLYNHFIQQDLGDFCFYYKSCLSERLLASKIVFQKFPPGICNLNLTFLLPEIWEELGIFCSTRSWFYNDNL